MIDRMDDALRLALHQLDEAIDVTGPAPAVHRTVMAKHRAEWPTLWAAIDAVRSAAHQTTN